MIIILVPVGVGEGDTAECTVVAAVGITVCIGVTVCGERSAPLLTVGGLMIILYYAII